MLEPSEIQYQRLLKKYYNIIADIQSQCIGSIQEVRKYVYLKLKEIEDGKTSYTALKTFITAKYTEMFFDLKNNIIETYNKAAVFEKTLAEQTLGKSIAFEGAAVKTLPTSKAFEVTNKILSEKSILKRNKILAERVTTIISNGVEQGSSIAAIQRKLDIEFGFRNAQGQITDKAKALIKEGKFTHRNGHIYQTYRIARTEAMRMASIRTRELFDNIERDDKRLKLVSVLDERTRYQSSIMNGLISDEKGRFKYPDGKYYYLGEQPKQWVINDRETSCVVYLDDPQTANALEKQNKQEFDSFEEFSATGDSIAQQAVKQRKNKDKAVEFLRNNTDKETLSKFINIGTLPKDCINSLGAKSQDIKFSLDNYIKNKIKHPEIGTEIYGQIQGILKSPDYLFQGENNRLRFFKTYDNNLYEMVVKTTKDKTENYLLSLHISDFSKIEKMKR